MSTPDPPDVERLRAALAQIGYDAEWPDVDADRLFSALHGELDAAARREIVDELIANPRAAAIWRLARELDPDASDAPATTAGAAVRAWPPQGTPVRTWSSGWLAIAATLALAIGAAWQFQPWRSDPPVYRGAETRAIASQLPRDQWLPRARAELRWTAIEGARYRVRVLTADLDVLEEFDGLQTPAYTVSPAALARIPSGGQVLWQVEASTPGADPVVSPTFSTRVE
jgi:hypothetical protein